MRRAGGRMMPSGGGGGGASSTLVTRPPGIMCIEMIVLLDAVLVDLEFVLRQVGDEVALVVLDDDVLRDSVDLHAERRLRLLRGRRGRGRRGTARRAGVCADRPAATTTQTAVDQKPCVFTVIAP